MVSLTSLEKSNSLKELFYTEYVMTKRISNSHRGEKISTTMNAVAIFCYFHCCIKKVEKETQAPERLGHCPEIIEQESSGVRIWTQVCLTSQPTLPSLHWVVFRNPDPQAIFWLLDSSDILFQWKSSILRVIFALIEMICAEYVCF